MLNHEFLNAYREQNTKKNTETYGALDELLKLVPGRMLKMKHCKKHKHGMLVKVEHMFSKNCNNTHVNQPG